jgi:hypothetical protein
VLHCAFSVHQEISIYRLVSKFNEDKRKVEELFANVFTELPEKNVPSSKISPNRPNLRTSTGKFVQREAEHTCGQLSGDLHIMQNILLASKPTTQWLSSSDFLALVELKLYTVVKCASVVIFYVEPVRFYT